MKLRILLPATFLLSSLTACGGGTTTAGTEATGGGEAPNYAGPVTSTDVAGGLAAFTTSCGGCHTGQAGSYGPVLRDLHRTPEAVRQVIREGRNRMPGFAASQISADDLEKVMAFLQSIGTVAPAN